jgi:hypothetical protein
MDLIAVSLLVLGYPELSVPPPDALQVRVAIALSSCKCDRKNLDPETAEWLGRMKPVKADVGIVEPVAKPTPAPAAAVPPQSAAPAPVKPTVAVQYAPAPVYYQPQQVYYPPVFQQGFSAPAYCAPGQ